MHRKPERHHATLTDSYGAADLLRCPSCQRVLTGPLTDEANAASGARRSANAAFGAPVPSGVTLRLITCTGSFDGDRSYPGRRRGDRRAHRRGQRSDIAT